MTIPKPSRNEGQYFAQHDAELLQKERAAAEAAATAAERKTHYMKCPKDGYDLASKEYHGVLIETCPRCGGMWIDADDLDAVAHEHRPALLTRIITDALGSLPHVRDWEQR